MHYKDRCGRRRSLWGYCIEQGVSFPDVTSYRGRNAENDSYFSNLPKKARTGIMLATIFWQDSRAKAYRIRMQSGWLVLGHTDDNMGISAETKDIPQEISGTAMFPQTISRILWRVRTAERCYNWMLSKMENTTRSPPSHQELRRTLMSLFLKNSYKRASGVLLWTIQQNGRGYFF